jgi:hypothetical protein
MVILAKVTEPARVERDTLVQVASAWWPRYDWHRAEIHRGAFHDVLVIPGEAVARLGRHADAARQLSREHRILTIFSTRHARWFTPKALSPVRTTPQGHAGILTSWIPGSHQARASWPQVAGDITTLLSVIQKGEAFQASRKLAGPRGWCGGPRFPLIVTGRLLPMLSDPNVRNSAQQVLKEMLAAERAAEPVPVHGDLGMHNILWRHADVEERTELTVTGLIDLDHAAMGDPAIDIAPLLGQFGSAVLASAVGSEILHRAMLHRATLSLQVAAAAELRDDAALRDFALANFVTRYRAGTLYDPDGAKPTR